jgi:glutamate dehydrogenase
MGQNGATQSHPTPPTHKLPPASPPPQNFTDQFFANLLPDDLIALTADRKHLASSIWRFIQKRPKGTFNLRLFNPDRKKDGWSVDHTVLEFVGDDMPFIVDSIVGELVRRGLTVHLSLHPVMMVNRDKHGILTGLSGDGAEQESLIHVQFDRCLDAQILDAIEKDLRSILAEVRATVEDRSKMRQKSGEVIAEILSPSASLLPIDEIEEMKNFLNWLNSKNFTYLGYRSLSLVKKGAKAGWAVDNGSGLGILRDDNARVFGDLIEATSLPVEILHALEEQRLVVIVKTNTRSRVHRTVHMDAIFVQRFDAKNQLVGQHLFVGLFTSASYAQSTIDVPLLRQKIAAVVARANFDPAGHNGRSLMHILDRYPRDELFQIDTETLYKNTMSIVQLQDRARVALFLRKDVFGRFFTCLVYVPRERYDARVAGSIQTLLEEVLSGRVMDQNVRISTSPLARIFLTIMVPPDTKMPDCKVLEDYLRDLCRSWPDRLKESLIPIYGEAEALRLFQRYVNAFPRAYQNATHDELAAQDIVILESMLPERDLHVDLSLSQNDHLLHLKLFKTASPIVLSDILPLIENMGLRVQHTGGPYEIVPVGAANKIYLHEFVCHAEKLDPKSFALIKPVFEEAFAKILIGEAENDLFNGLTLTCALPWRDVVVLRTFARYLHQLRIPYGHILMGKALLANAEITKKLIALFLARHDPDFKGDRKRKMADVTDEILADLAQVSVLEEDRILRRYLNLVQASLRTNHFQRRKDGSPKPYLAIKFDSRAIGYMPLPKPLLEIFVTSPKVEAVHLRGGKVARGGIRWSDRRDDFRNEILGLMKAQMVKNSVIVPVGSKGGFIVKNPSSDPETFRAEGVSCYQTLIRGLLDVTDNRVHDKIVPPERVVRHDGDDPYLVVAADKGTATFSDIANELAQEYGFWLDDAFASGGSAGYDHKQMGITARGAWESVKRHFRECGKDTQTTDFTCVGVGDMSGDVFGNAMLLSEHIRLLAAFDHRHIFCDPNPDAAVSYAERKRLFDLPRSNWKDYDARKMSKGGAIYARTDKTLKLTPEIKKTFGIAADTLTPPELIQILLRAKIDLLYFGGIGTYVKASAETDEAAKDRANDALRINASEIRANVVAEGANLGLTQKARIEYALRGGRLNTDAIDNSAGVSTSDHEVNIKILLSKIVRDGTLSVAARNKILAGMTDNVAALVLRDNYLQTEALSIAEAQASQKLPLDARAMRVLEKSGLLNRAIEYLPDEAEIAERQRLGKGLTRPESAILMAYTKIWLYEKLLVSDLVKDPFLHEDLLKYFPAALQKKYPELIPEHQLKSEIVATALTNDLVNRLGHAYVFEIAQRTGKAPTDVARAYLLARASFDLPSLWAEVESLDNQVPASVQTNMLLSINKTLVAIVTWFINQDDKTSDLGAIMARNREGVKHLMNWFAKNATTSGSAKAQQDLIAQGVPSNLAGRVAILPSLTLAADIAQLADKTGRTIEQAAGIFFGLEHRLGLDWLREHAEAMQGLDLPWQREAIAVVLEDIAALQRSLATKILKRAGDQDKGTALEGWIAKKADLIEGYDSMLGEIRANAAPDLAMLTLIGKQLEALAA